MKLLLDENLSRRILPLLEASYPGSSHVSLLGMERADDKSIWLFAQQAGYVIVTKDDDFQALLNTLGHPPKLVRLRMRQLQQSGCCHSAERACCHHRGMSGRSGIGAGGTLRPGAIAGTMREVCVRESCYSYASPWKARPASMPRCWLVYRRCGMTAFRQRSIF